jgi:hypothetical protein
MTGALANFKFQAEPSQTSCNSFSPKAIIAAEGAAHAISSNSAL